MKSKRYLIDEELHKIRHEEDILKGLSIQEAIEYNKNLREYMKITDKTSEYKFLQENYEALDMAIKALEQTELNLSYYGVKSELKPCEDAISRAEAIYRIEVRRKITCESDPYNYEEWTKGYEEGIDDAIAMINSVPSITPQPKIGKWIKIEPYPLQMHEYKCSECGHETNDNTESYCSECGAKMEVEDE